MIPTNLRARFDGAMLPLVATVLAILLMASLTAVALTTVSTAGAVSDRPATDRPTVDVATTTLADDGTATVAVTLSAAPEGLSGYNLELAVADAGVARIDSASYPDRFGLTTEPKIGDDGRTVTLEAADLDGEIGPGATNVTLARVTVTGVAPGAADLEVRPVQFDGDNGSAIEPVPEPGVVTVGPTGGGATATSADEPGGDAAVPADDVATTGATTAGTTTTSADGALATLPLFGAAGLLLLGSVAIRRRRS